MYYTEQGDYDSYSDWTEKSPEWKEIKDLIYASRIIRYRCNTCYIKYHLLVHKRSYAHLEPEFFKLLIRKRNKRLLKKILSYQCHRCNDLLHFYDKKKLKKVELDYLFLTERERVIRYRVDMIIRRLFRGVKQGSIDFYYAYSIGNRKRASFR